MNAIAKTTLSATVMDLPASPARDIDPRQEVCPKVCPTALYIYIYIYMYLQYTYYIPCMCLMYNLK